MSNRSKTTIRYNKNFSQETQKYGNVIIRNNAPKSAKNTSKEQNENAIQEAEPESLNQSKINFYSEYNEASFLRTAIGDEMTRAKVQV